MKSPRVAVHRSAVGITVRASLTSPEGFSAVTIQTAPLPSEAEAVAEFSRLVAEVFQAPARDSLLRALRRELEITREV
jgi:hypothetical protein